MEATSDAKITYRAGPDAVTGQIALFARTGARLPFRARPDIPVAIFTGLEESLSIKQVADHVAALLNDMPSPAAAALRTDASLYYSRSAQAITLRTHQSGAVSQPAVIMNVSSKSSVADLGTALLARMDEGFMKNLCERLQSGAAARPQLQGPQAQP